MGGQRIINYSSAKSKRTSTPHSLSFGSKAQRRRFQAERTLHNNERGGEEELKEIPQECILPLFPSHPSVTFLASAPRPGEQSTGVRAGPDTWQRRPADRLAVVVGSARSARQVRGLCYYCVGRAPENNQLSRSRTAFCFARIFVGDTKLQHLLR